MAVKLTALLTLLLTCLISWKEVSGLAFAYFGYEPPVLVLCSSHCIEAFSKYHSISIRHKSEFVFTFVKVKDDPFRTIKDAVELVVFILKLQS